ncbi:MAG: hypothetical protein A2X25_08965 [Chloroflexi bacterium GWB2_49_20]|nr:MAG: hypothetical protein A2X25_08965 [Chloroflexi bacterium GWB2_49_20]OGN79437.1 MAG: hypothetical protein A2X26_05060 [Chloroflexi bacterium GWC2_49_37]OGN82794.1 MAG: hypothetical protein A2X27_07635 [Chloroflexi bacterium GWD2_49_16]HCC79694.1 hypothetical protein [Anaerolineae bacterium]HCM97266.1 hypothetical protein [Anaerolineae bacterium]
MELTKKDRLMLINQYEILKVLDNDNKKFYDELIEILKNGFEMFYSNIVEWLSEDMSHDAGQLVLDILSIYRGIETYKRNNPSDDEIANHYWGYFKGFDGNNEYAYRNFTLFLIEIQEKFTEQNIYKAKTDSFNSHGITLDKYKNMIEQWNNIEKDISTRENILSILEAG